MEGGNDELVRVYKDGEGYFIIFHIDKRGRERIKKNEHNENKTGDGETAWRGAEG